MVSGRSTRWRARSRARARRGRRSGLDAGTDPRHRPRAVHDQGYDKTSLREIAERLGFSKAAIYYHFASKADILMALHMRLHEFGREALDAMGDGP